MLAETGKAAICKIVLKDREQLAALNPYQQTMLLSTLHWPDEVRSLGELNLPEDEIEIKPGRAQDGRAAGRSMTGEFDPEQDHDEYREALMKVIEAKVAGEKPEPAKQAEPTKIGDLMAALEASVAAARETRRDGAKAEEKEAKPARAKASDPQGEGRRVEEAPAARRRKTA